jgi:hypothetical protein
MKKWQWWAVGGVGLCALIYLLYPSRYCRSARSKYGIEVEICPDGKVRQQLFIQGNALRRAGDGYVTLRADALYTIAAADAYRRATIPKIDAKLSLVDGHGKERPLEKAKGVLKVRDGWTFGRGFAQAKVRVPRVDDGDYKLRARITTKVGKGTVDLPLALYSPAKIHVLTDRPLYEPGHRVQFRALMVRARDLSPLSNRPGRWLIQDPSGQTVLEEKASAGPWGVVAGNFLLDKQAPNGRWKVIWRSGSESGQTTIRVEPFTLPRFRVSGSPAKPFYRSGEEPLVTGSVVYSSGAPVQGAKLSISWSVSGRWPPPTSWLSPMPGSKADTLPKKTITDASGRFRLQLPKVPLDLQGRATLHASVQAIDPAGDRVTGSFSVPLSEDAIRVSAITPLANGLVSGFNNRIYLRVTTADGQPLPGATIKVRKAWLDSGEGTDAKLDEDSVARLQFDPGAPVNVVIPPRPVRRSAVRRGVIRRTRAYDMVAEGQAGLDDQVEMDKWLALLKPCSKWVGDEHTAKVVLRVAKTGAVLGGTHGRNDLARCVFALLKNKRLAVGAERLYRLDFRFPEPRLPKLSVSSSEALSSNDGPIAQLLERAARDTRDCLPTSGSGSLPAVLFWRIQAKARKPEVSWMWGADKKGVKLTPALQRCIMTAVKAAQLPTPAEESAMGVAHLTLSQPGQVRNARPRPTIIKGYELLVSANVEGKEVGKTKLRMRPGRIPRLAMRIEPVLPTEGQELKIRLLRGPTFRGGLPRRLYVTHFGGTKRIKRKKNQTIVKYKLPPGKRGWFTFSAAGATALVYVRSKKTLAVSITPQKQRYAPGSKARLDILTQVGTQGGQAAVGLFGVDQTLQQLATLPGPDALRRLQPKIRMRGGKAFGLLDGQALVLGAYEASSRPRRPCCASRKSHSPKSSMS